MRKKRLICALAVAVLLPTIETALARTSPQGRAEREDTASACRQRLSPLSKSDHILIVSSESPVLRRLGGHLLSADGKWPDGADPVLEVVPAQKAPQDWTLLLSPDEEGAFSGPRLEAGAYCYKASASGWQTIIGAFEIRTSAPEESSLAIQLPLGV